MESVKGFILLYAVYYYIFSVYVTTFRAVSTLIFIVNTS